MQLLIELQEIKKVLAAHDIRNKNIAEKKLSNIKHM